MRIITKIFPKVFICFAAEDRYKIAEPIAYHLTNYGIGIWYDRQKLLMGDDRIQKNLTEGVAKCQYAIIILSKDTEQSICAMEEISILEGNYFNDNVTLFPVLYELSSQNIPNSLQWIKKIIYKEVNSSSGTLEICNHVACKITLDILEKYQYKTISEFLCYNSLLPPIISKLLKSYQAVDCENLNSRVTLLYAIYVNILYLITINNDSTINMVSKIFERLFSETRLNLAIDYREIWLLENCICILLNYCTESKI